MRNKDTLEIIRWAAGAGFTRLEMTSAHVGLEKDASRDEAVKKALSSGAVHLSSIAHYDGGILNDPDKSVEALKKAVDRCVYFDTDVLCALAGLPLANKTKEESIRERLGLVFKPVCAYAADKGIKVALENWFATCIQDFGLWDLAIETVGAENFGFNYDPSHLLWQGIDYIGGVRLYADRIFHVHAKDTSIDDAVRMRVGYLARGWWRYTIPGRGRVDWGEFVSALGKVKYQGVLSIEHEDGSVGVEDGLLLGKKYLENFVA